MNQSTNTSAPQTLDLLTKSLSIACDMAPADIDVSEHLQVREFLLTACAVVVILTAFNTLKTMVKRIGNNLKKKASTSNRSKKNPNTKVTPKSDGTDTNVKSIDDTIDTHVENVNETIDTSAETIKDGKGGEIYEMMILHCIKQSTSFYSNTPHQIQLHSNKEGQIII